MVESTYGQKSSLIDCIRSCNRDWVQNFDLDKFLSESNEGNLDLDQLHALIEIVTHDKSISVAHINFR